MYNPYQQNYGMNWCQGEAGAKSFPVSPGNTVAIFDSEENTFYVKSVDVMGRPLPLKICDYVERDNAPKLEEKKYVEKDTLDETISSFNEKLDEVIELLMKTPEKKVDKEKKDAK